MAKTNLFTKHALISQASSRMVVAASIATFIVVFGLVASKTLVSQVAYQNKVINARKTAQTTLQNDLKARDGLVTAYKSFISTPQNIIGGSTTGTGSKDGDNAKIVLDALPSSYDFPALTTSIAALVTGNGLSLNSITGTDDELAQSAQTTTTSPQPVPMPFEVQVSGSFGNVKNFVTTLENSIRPIQVQTVSLSGSDNDMQADITAQTFYQPGKSLNIKTQVVK